MSNASAGISLAKIQLTNLMLLGSVTLAAWIAFSGKVSLSILVGGVIATLSFYWLKKDVHSLFSGPLGAVKIHFFIKYYARLAVLALILYFLIRNEKVDIFGLLTGLSTVVTSILITALGAARKVHSSLKEAS